ncbi:hypothetical protein MYP_3298 [Sporocytophaga myxococcoides]|uniref:Uncharacterized protein n=1 Tax=Sporocytophaga myxococcoides TaxID=153721 RepID=A0A098LHZ1_9BACT|nr:hypothetical protein [Sporocytophaga myxococcoides]GAL86069.1 hypothetical protein MYP_3298 [Sporocytophaga myxococcoides]
MNKGEIYKLKNEFRKFYSPACYNHPFVYWEDQHADYTGIMLTTSNNPVFKNIELKQEHFRIGFKIGFGKSLSTRSYIAPLYLLKDVKYEHLDKVGELSNDGITFITNILNTLEYTDWKTYMKLT